MLRVQLRIERARFIPLDCVTAVSYTHLDVYKRQGQLTFLANRRYRPAVATTRASAILIAPDAGDVPLAALRSSNPYLDFARALEFFHPAPAYSAEVHPTASISRTAKIGAGAHIGPYCYVGENVEIGPVSYTHLDVYKRQRPNRPRKITKSAPKFT